MVKIIKQKDGNLLDNVKKLLLIEKAEMSASVLKTVAEIKNNILEKGDSALLEYTNKFDRTGVNNIEALKVTEAEIENAAKNCDKKLYKALELAASRIKKYHKKQLPKDIDYKDKQGIRLGNIWKPIETVGLYVPGGLASYPSSVLMNAIPAKVAGVQKIVMVVPSPENKLNDAVLVAAKIAGVDEIYKIGGAQAILALTYGTAFIPKVNKIVGPGNAYVAAAKKIVYGDVGIDMIAGPSEILVVADNNINPDWVAADLLSQAEHDENARSILITDDSVFAEKVINSIEKILPSLDREKIARKSWENNGAVIVVNDIYNSSSIIDEIAPEHLELCVKHPERLVKKINNAGAIFIGNYTPEAIGDYTAGPSHVLPTSSTAKFSSGLSVFDFLKRVSLIECSSKSFRKISSETSLLADTEGLGAHKLSVDIRNKE